MAGDLRRWQVIYPTDRLTAHLELTFFYKEQESVGKGFGIQEKAGKGLGIQGKANQMKAAVGDFPRIPSPAAG